MTKTRSPELFAWKLENFFEKSEIFQEIRNFSLRNRKFLARIHDPQISNEIAA